MRPQIDLAGAIDAASSGASTLIRQAMERKRTEAELALQQQREAREASAQQAELAFRQKEADDRGTERAQDFGLRQTAERHRFIEAGGLPAHTETIAQPAGQAPITPWQPQMPSSPITRALTPPTDAAALPVRVTPSSAPASTGPGDRVNANAAPAAVPGSVPINRPVNVETPESYDPTKSGAFERAIETQRLRNAGFVTRDEARTEFQSEQQQRRLAAQQAGREYASTAAKSLYDYKRAHPMPSKSGGIHGAMTAGQQHNMNVALAAGFLQVHGGYSQDALDTFRNTPEGQALAKSGLTENDLLEASTKLKRDPTTGQIVSIFTSGNAKDIPQAAGIVAQADSASKANRAKPAQLIRPGQPQPSQPGAPGAASGPPVAAAPALTTITKAEFEALKQKGFAEADIRKKYTVIP